MVRRRSPSPSAPVRRSSPSYSSAPRSSKPTSTAAQQAPASKGPGLFGQMAATAGGVAIGSSIGHAVGSMFGGGGHEAQPVQVSQDQQQNDQKQLENPCEVEWRQFVECTQNQTDMNYCQSFNDLFKNCKSRYAGYQN